MTPTRILSICLTALPLSIIPRSAMAQTATDSSVVQDVVVTAPSLSEVQATARQSTAGASSIVTQQRLEANQITNLVQAQRFQPSLQFKALNIQNLTYNIRGFGNASYSQLLGVFGGVPIYLDGVYLPRPGASTMDIVGLNGVEVLKGPQSTSGGWDSTGGVVLMTTAAPTFTPEQKLEFSYGSYNFARLRASISGPIGGSDKAAFSVGYLNVDREGYIPDVHDFSHRFNSWHDKSVRAQVLLQPDNDLSVRMIFDFSRATQQCCINLFNSAVTNYVNGAPVANNFYTRAARFNYTPTPNQLATYESDISGYVSEAVMGYGASAEVTYNFNGYTFSSLSAFRGYDYYPDWRTSQVIDIATNYHTNGSPRVKSIQEELKIATPKGQAAEATAGLFYYYEGLRTWGNRQYGTQAGSWFGNPAFLGQVDDLALNGLTTMSFAHNFTNQIAPFIQSVWHATPELDITTGLRYSYTEREGSTWGVTKGADLSGLTGVQQNAAVNMRQALGGPAYSLTNPFFSYGTTTHQGLVSGLASAAYHFAPDLLGYALYSHGGRPGGPNISTQFLPTGAPLTIKPETLDNYEIGLKSSFFDQRVIANVAAFVMVNRNYITSIAALTSLGTTTNYLANANAARARGVEVDIRAKPTEDLNFIFAGVYNDARFTDFKNGPCPFEQTNQQTAANPYCDMTGKPLSLVSRWTFTVGGEYSHTFDETIETLGKPVTTFIGADFSYQSKFYSNPDDSLYSVINGYGLLNLHAGLRANDDSWNFTGWVHNALNKHYFTTLSAALYPGAGIVGGSVGDPIMAGLTLAGKF